MARRLGVTPGRAATPCRQPQGRRSHPARAGRRGTSGRAATTGCLDHIVAEVTQRDLTDVTLVAHSWGGVPMTAAAHALAPRLARIVYLSAFVPEAGKPSLDELPDAVAQQFAA